MRVGPPRQTTLPDSVPLPPLSVRGLPARSSRAPASLMSSLKSNTVRFGVSSSAVGAKLRRGAPVRGRGQRGGRVGDVELVQLPDRHAVFLEVVRVDFQAAYIVVAHDQFVHHQIDRRHVLRRRRHGLAEQIVFRGRRNHQTGEAGLQRARRALDGAGQPGDVSGNLIRGDIGLPVAVVTRRADDHAFPVALEQRQGADVHGKAVRQELRQRGVGRDCAEPRRAGAAAASLLRIWLTSARHWSASNASMSTAAITPSVGSSAGLLTPTAPTTTAGGWPGVWRSR